MSSSYYTIFWFHFFSWYLGVEHFENYKPPRIPIYENEGDTWHYHFHQVTQKKKNNTFLLTSKIWENRKYFYRKILMIIGNTISFVEFTIFPQKKASRNAESSIMNVNNFVGSSLITRKLWIMKMTLQQYLVYLISNLLNQLSW